MQRIFVVVGGGGGGSGGGDGGVGVVFCFKFELLGAHLCWFTLYQ